MKERLRRLFESRFRIATQLYVGIGGAVVLTVGASLVWLVFLQQRGQGTEPGQ